MFPRINWKLLLFTYPIRLLNLVVISLFRFFRKLLRSGFNKIGNLFVKKKSPAIVLVLLIAFTFVTLQLILPNTHIFEGYLTVQEMSFISAQENQTLLRNIYGISQISVEGIQSLTLTGRFSSKTNPELNQSLSQLDKLDLLLKSEKGQWIVVPTNSKDSQLALLDLRLQKYTEVAALSYNSYGSRLSLFLKQIQSDNQKSKQTNFLQLALGKQPLKIVITGGYQLPQLKLQDNSSNPKAIEFNYIPDNEEFRLPITQPVTICVGLPNSSEEHESEQWFRGSIEVKNVKFYTSDRSGSDIRDDFRTSTVLRGEIRMAERELKIQRKQFLMPIPEDPGIQLLRGIQITPSNSPQDAEIHISGESLKTEKPSQGLEVRFSGKARSIQAGLDPRFPVANIQAGFLAGRLPNDVVTFLISGLTAVIVTLLSWLLDNMRTK